MKFAALTLSLVVGANVAVLAVTKEEVPWSYRPVTRPEAPQVRDGSWAKDEVDRFILAKIEAAGLRPNADADRRTWLRRAALDLTGLLPTPQELQTFLRDPSPDDAAFARAVDGYLKSPRFGERWARHWLDVVRYADSVGRTWNAPFTYAWRYRDWVIDSFNADKSYQRFVGEQIAGDLLPAKTVEQRRDQIVGTGLLALGSMELPGGQLERFTMDRVDDEIDVVTRAFLGLTVSCARCHDHKTEPIGRRDYYALAGIFYSTRTLSGQGHSGDMTGAGYVDPELLVDLPTRLDAPVGPPKKLPQGIHSMGDAMALGGGLKQPARFDVDPHFAMGAVEGELRDSAIRIGGDAYELGETPVRGDVRIPSLPALPPVPAGASGRLELARWVVSPTNPLTARVMVNRVWQHLFGRGLVRTVDDFGKTGTDPSHPELLDHLAARFVEGEWSVKKLIRAMMLSRTYRLSSASAAAGREKDPDNELYWRMSPRRLEFEALRDTMLQVADGLKYERPAGIQVAGFGGKGRAGTTTSLLDLSAPYRTVYLPVLRDKLPEAYSTFDFPEPTQIKGQRYVTTSPPQALFAMNSDFAVQTARDAAQRIIESSEKKEDEQVRIAYRCILCREPEASELAAARQLLTSLESDNVRDRQIYRWTALVQALMGTAEFRYVW
jgi:hypothetical protein